jgi:FkbM family methyltransferase
MFRRCRRAARGPRERAGPIGNYRRAQYYRSLLGTAQTAKLYGARALRRDSITLEVPGVAHPLVCRLPEPDPFTLCHVFAARECEVPIPLAPTFIIDAGANVGYAAVFYANQYPGASIVALEPHTGNLETARLNCLPYPNVELLLAGLWSQDGALEIANPNARSWGFRLRGSAGETPGTVPGFSVPGLLERARRERVDILKLDIEGAEEQLFGHGSQDWLPFVDVVVVETHGQSAQRAVDTAMRDARFAQLREQPRNVFVHPRLS